MVEVNLRYYVDELMKTCAWEELTELKGKPIRDFQFLNWNIFLKAETDFENTGEKISKRYWDTSASSQVSNCDGVVLEICLNHNDHRRVWTASLLHTKYLPNSLDHKVKKKKEKKNDASTWK